MAVTNSTINIDVRTTGLEELARTYRELDDNTSMLSLTKDAEGFYQVLNKINSSNSAFRQLPKDFQTLSLSEQVATVNALSYSNAVIQVANQTPSIQRLTSSFSEQTSVVSGVNVEINRQKEIYSATQPILNNLSQKYQELTSQIHNLIKSEKEEITAAGTVIKMSNERRKLMNERYVVLKEYQKIQGGSIARAAQGIAQSKASIVVEKQQVAANLENINSNKQLHSSYLQLINTNGVYAMSYNELIDKADQITTKINQFKASIAKPNTGQDYITSTQKKIDALNIALSKVNTAKFKTPEGAVNIEKQLSGINMQAQYLITELPNLAQSPLIFVRSLSNNLTQIGMDMQRTGASFKQVMSLIGKSLMSVTGVVGIAVTALTLLISNWDKVVAFFSSGSKSINKAVREAFDTSSVASSMTIYSSLRQEWEKLETVAQRTKFLDQYKDKLTEIGVGIESVNEGERFFSGEGEKSFTTSINRRAMAIASLGVATEKYKEIFDAISKDKKLFESFASGEQDFETFRKYIMGDVETLTNTIFKYVNGKEYEFYQEQFKNIDALNKLYNDNLKKSDESLGGFKLSGSITGKTDKDIKMDAGRVATIWAREFYKPLTEYLKDFGKSNDLTPEILPDPAKDVRDWTAKLALDIQNSLKQFKETTWWTNDTQADSLIESILGAQSDYENGIISLEQLGSKLLEIQQIAQSAEFHNNPFSFVNSPELKSGLQVLQQTGTLLQSISQLQNERYQNALDEAKLDDKLTDEEKKNLKKMWKQKKAYDLAAATTSGLQAVMNALSITPWPVGAAMAVISTGLMAANLKQIIATKAPGLDDDGGGKLPQLPNVALPAFGQYQGGYETVDINDVESTPYVPVLVVEDLNAVQGRARVQAQETTF